MRIRQIQANEEISRLEEEEAVNETAEVA